MNLAGIPSVHYREIRVEQDKACRMLDLYVRKTELNFECECKVHEHRKGGNFCKSFNVEVLQEELKQCKSGSSQ